jgi:hypothetical protein
MHADMVRLMRIVPPASELAATATRVCDAWVASGRAVTSAEVTRLTVEIFCLFLFERPWFDGLQAIVDASWEWRAHIALRRPANEATKRTAVAVMVDDLIPRSRFAALFTADEWRDPRRHSLLLQPFFISPSINASDLLVAMKQLAPCSLDYALTNMHPFPIFERWVDAPVELHGQVVVPANTQVVMFTDDFVGAKGWPLWGAGQRACTGSHLGAALVRAMYDSLSKAKEFRPEEGHRHSGRNNDTSMSLGEFWFFLRTVASAVFVQQ